MILNRQNCKRKFSISFKLKCVNEIENSSIRTISKRYEISRNVLRKWTRNRGLYAQVKKQYWRNNISSARQAHFPELERLLHSDIQDARSKGATIGQQFIRMRAMEIAIRLGIIHFRGLSFINPFFLFIPY
jgi:transposase-like protein